MNFSSKFKKKEKHKESANKEANNEFQKDDKIGTFEEERNDPTAFMSISLSSSNETIAPSTSKKTETVQSKLFSKHSIQKKREIKKKRSFFGTKLAFKRRDQRSFVSKSAASFKRHLNVDSDSQKKEASNKIEPNKRRKYSRKGVNKNFKVNNLFLS